LRNEPRSNARWRKFVPQVTIAPGKRRTVGGNTAKDAEYEVVKLLADILDQRHGIINAASKEAILRGFHDHTRPYLTDGGALDPRG